MNNIIHEQLNNLRLIALIKEGDKLDLADGALSIQDSSWRGWIWRQQLWVPKKINSKEETVRYLRELYICIYQQAEQIHQELSRDAENIRARALAISLSDKLNSSFQGLRNLCKTYQCYARQCVEISGIIDDYGAPAFALLSKYNTNNIALELKHNDNNKIIIDNGDDLY
jgi:hypothetical protein